MSEKNSKYKYFEKLERKKVSHNWINYVWKLFSFLGEKFYKKYPPLRIHPSGNSYLNLGAGGEIKNGFVNADFYRFNKLYSNQRSEWFLDITKNLKCYNSYWDGIYLSHVNEHLTYIQNYKLFLELFRIIKPGCILRIIIPDLDTYLSWENKITDCKNKMNRYGSLPEAISNLTQNHQHISIWNYNLLKDVLTEIGFSKVSKVSFNVGEDKNLLIDNQDKEWESFYCEAIK